MSDDFIYPKTEEEMEKEFRILRENVIIGKELFREIYSMGYKQGAKDREESLFEM